MKSTNEVAVKIGDRHCRIQSDDNYLEHVRGEFEPHMVDIFKALTGDSRVILDIGANIGCTAILFGDLANSVHAFEPSPTTYGFLKRNVESNGAGNIHLHNHGLGSVAATTTITFASNNRSGGFVSNQTKASSGHETEEISIRTVDEIAAELALENLDFIKIDVEGFEGHVLKGASATLVRHRPVVVLELNHWCLNAFQRTSVPDFFDQLRSVFPILLAVDNGRYLNLHSPDESYEVMYHHIMGMRFQNVIGAYDEAQLAEFYSRYPHNSVPREELTPVQATVQQRRASIPPRIARRALRIARRVFD